MGRGSGLVPPPARFLSAAPSCAGFLGVNYSEAACTGSRATLTAGGVIPSSMGTRRVAYPGHCQVRRVGGRRRGVHARRCCAQARRRVGGYQSPSPTDRRK